MWDVCQLAVYMIVFVGGKEKRIEKRGLVHVVLVL